MASPRAACRSRSRSWATRATRRPRSASAGPTRRPPTGTRAGRPSDEMADLTRPYDVLVIGGGNAALCAAITAREAGALVLEDRRVREAVLSSKGFPETVRATSVVASSGGFQGNIEWLKEYWGEAAENFLIRGTPYARGRILRNLLDQGVASVGDPTQCHAVAIAARAPRFDGGIVTRLDCIPFGIVVDRAGKRFYDEGEDLWPKRYAIWGRLVAQQPGQIAYCIVDAKAERLFMPSVFPAIRAGSIAELARAFGLDAGTLESTVKQF